MNHISKKPISSLGYNFIPKEFIPKGKDEYYLRNIQNRSGIKYRKLTDAEIKILERNANSSDDWNNVLVSDAFNPNLVKSCTFYGLVRIGKLEPYFVEFNNLRLPVGLYHSTIISCDIGDNVVIDNVNFMSHYITGNEVILVNINELANALKPVVLPGEAMRVFILKEGKEHKESKESKESASPSAGTAEPATPSPAGTTQSPSASAIDGWQSPSPAP